MTFTTNSGVTTFFQAFEQALESNDPARMAEIYHSSFLFGGPGGAQTVKLEDFLKVIPKRTAFAKQLGLRSTRLVSVEPAALDEVYALAKAVWKMTVENKGARHELLAEATYLLLGQADGYRIVAQIDHQDLLERLKKI